MYHFFISFSHVPFSISFCTNKFLAIKIKKCWQLVNWNSFYTSHSIILNSVICCVNCVIVIIYDNLTQWIIGGDFLNSLTASHKIPHLELQFFVCTIFLELKRKKCQCPIAFILIAGVFARSSLNTGSNSLCSHGFHTIFSPIPQLFI